MAFITQNCVDICEALVQGKRCLLNADRFAAREILNATLGLEFEHQLTPWYARPRLEFGRWAVAFEVGTCLTTWCLCMRY